MEEDQPRSREMLQQRIAEQEQSGLTVQAYCEEHGVAAASFYNWRKHLWSHVSEGVGLLQTDTQRNNQPTRKEIMLELVLVSGDRLRIPNNEATLRLVLGLLRERGPQDTRR